MNSKTLVTAVVAALVGVGLAVGTVSFAQNTGHMGNYQNTGMMGQTTQKTGTLTHGTMHGQTVLQNTHGNMHGKNFRDHNPGTHHANAGRFAADAPCHQVPGKALSKAKTK